MKKYMLVILLCSSVYVMARTFVLGVCPVTPEITPVDVPFTYDELAAPAPVIGWLELTANSLLIKTLKGCDEQADPFVFEAIMMPIGMTFDPITNRLRWQPTTDQIGIHWIAVKVTDDPPAGSIPASETRAWIINVTPRANTAPHILPFGVDG